MAKKVSNWFRIGVEGDTCDGRVISGDDIQDMADTFDPRVYGCRINLEHIRGLMPDSPFKRYGDVIELKAEIISDGSALDGKKALFGKIAPLDELVSMVDDGKVETVSYDSQDHEIVFEAKDDKGKTALYKTGIFPDDALVDRLLKGNVKFAAEIPTQASPLVSMLVSYIVPIVLIIAVGQWLQKKMMKNMVCMTSSGTGLFSRSWM